MACGRPDDEQPIFTRPDGGLWRSDDWCNWRGRCWRPAATAAGCPAARPYDLRHSFVSMLIAEGANPVEVARQAGHAPSLSLDTYGHVYDEASGGERVSAEDAIRAAREFVPPMCPAASTGEVRVSGS